MMDILDKLNSGELHAEARARRPECVCAKGNIHRSPERARFVDWVNEKRKLFGFEVREWPHEARAEYDNRYVSST